MGLQNWNFNPSNFPYKFSLKKQYATTAYKNINFNDNHINVPLSHILRKFIFIICPIRSKMQDSSFQTANSFQVISVMLTTVVSLYLKNHTESQNCTIGNIYIFFFSNLTQEWHLSKKWIFQFWLSHIESYNTITWVEKDHNNHLV